MFLVYIGTCLVAHAASWDKYFTEIFLQYYSFSESANSSFYAEQISLAEYEKQKSEFTKAQVNALINSPAYQRKHNSCRT